MICDLWYSKKVFYTKQFYPRFLCVILSSLCVFTFRSPINANEYFTVMAWVVFLYLGTISSKNLRQIIHRVFILLCSFTYDSNTARNYSYWPVSSYHLHILTILWFVCIISIFMAMIYFVSDTISTFLSEKFKNDSYTWSNLGIEIT